MLNLQYSIVTTKPLSQMGYHVQVCMGLTPNHQGHDHPKPMQCPNDPKFGTLVHLGLASDFSIGFAINLAHITPLFALYDYLIFFVKHVPKTHLYTCEAHAGEILHHMGSTNHQLVPCQSLMGSPHPMVNSGLTKSCEKHN